MPLIDLSMGPQDVGKVLLLPEGAITISGTNVTLSALTGVAAVASSNNASTSNSSTNSSLMPRVMKRGGRGRGRGGIANGNVNRAGLGAKKTRAESVAAMEE